MRLAQHANVKTIAILGLLAPSPVFAQPMEACGTSGDLLFYCTFGTQQASVCLSETTVSYQFGRDWVSPELRLSQSAIGGGYIPNDIANEMLNESITFLNGDTSYKISMSSQRPNNPDAITAGSILVTSSNGDEQLLNCDAGSVEPQDPRDGLGILESFNAENRTPTLWRCTDNALEIQNCVGFVHDLDLQQGRCEEEGDFSGCWAGESEAWDELVTANFEWVLEYVTAVKGERFAATLSESQTSWEQSRALDCSINGSWPLPPLPDAGNAFCRANYSAQRLQFLRNVKLFSDYVP